MTPRKELFLVIRNKIATIPGIENVDLQRNQFASGKENYPQFLTCCLIKIVGIQWETMTEQMQEGKATIEVILYTLDGFADQHFGTADNSDGLAELDLIDAIAEKLQFLRGITFKPLQQTSDEPEDLDEGGIMAHKLSFSASVYKTTAPKYQTKNIIIS